MRHMLENPPMQTDPDGLSVSIAEALNQGCICLTLDAASLQEKLEHDPSLKGLYSGMALSHPHLFSRSAVFLSKATCQAIADAVSAIERVMALPFYQAKALESAPAIAQPSFGPLGAFMGYDFHVEVGQHMTSTPQLIEVNTNAGGALLNAALARAHRACCEPMGWAMESRTRLEALEQTFFGMFMNEWHLQRGTAVLRSVAIVDDHPQTQYLAPEFALCRQMFAQRGVQAIITDPRELSWRGGRLWHGNTPIDMVYNRLTDFDLSESAHQALHDAYLAGAVVVTPHPHAHALRANKRNLVMLCDDALLSSWGVDAADRQCLGEVVPATELVTRAHADALWARRRQLFFKPVAGYAGKAAYRGDKLTRRVWDEILAGEFIAQKLVLPGKRRVDVGGVATDLKFDVRAYSYDGKIQLLAARTYNGQTTNFRTAGGGFSPVMIVPRIDLTTAQQAALMQSSNICPAC